jgi:hypothetical protein
MLEHEALERKKQIVNSLYFEGIQNRYQSVPKSHQETFECVFDSATTPFSDWLATGGGVFWVAGNRGQESQP